MAQTAEVGPGGCPFFLSNRVRNMNGKFQTKADVAQFLDLEEDKLNYILFKLKVRKNYSSFKIEKKSGGKRVISVPPKKILWWQRKIYQKLSEYYVRKKCVHGFVKDFSIVTNAKSHVSQRFVINIDIKDYFDSIHYGRIYGALIKEPFSFGQEAAKVIAQICTMSNGVVPQGGATSPIISNIISRTFDNKMLQLAREMKFRYSRYADDITISCNRESILSKIVKPTNKSGYDLTPIIEKIFIDNSFVVNKKKLRVQDYSGHQEVTGLTVNKFPNVQRKYIKGIEGALNAWEKYGYECAQNMYKKKYFREGISGDNLDYVLKGKIAYLNMVRGHNDFLYRRIARRFNRLSNIEINIETLDQIESSRLNNSRPQNGWETWFEKYKSQVKLLSVEDKEGNRLCGSAFHIGNGVFATAGHNLVDSNGDPRKNILIYHEGNEVIPKVLGAGFRNETDVGAFYLDAYDSNVRIPTQLRLPACGEEVAAIGFPTIPLRDSTLVLHIGTIEALPTYYATKHKYIQVSFQSGGGLSGGCLIDKAGFIVGIMVENVFLQGEEGVPSKPYGQAIPIEYFDEEFHSQYQSKL